MNLTEIRAAMFAQADWSPEQSEEAVGRINGFINRAYNQLALEAPFLFFEDKLRVAVEPDEKSASDSDTLQLLGNNELASAAVDPWSFVTTYTKTVAEADTDGAYTTTWKTDRSWDGRVIEFETSDGTKVRNRIRTIWYDSSDDKYKLTVVHPWDWSNRGTGSSTATDFKWRIYTEEYPFPDDIIKMRSMRLFNNTQQYPIDVMGQDEAEERTLVGPRAQVASGIPRIAFRREHFQLEGPGAAPSAEKAPDTTLVGLNNAPTPTYPWNGPEKPGEFQYVVTYTWGKRDADFRLPGLAKWDTYAAAWTNTGQTIAQAPGNEPANNRVREPRYESAPSPASGTQPVEFFDEADKTKGYTAIKVRVPNIEYALGFLTEHPSGSPSGKRVSQHQSGIHVRIYRRRVSVFDDTAFDPYRDMSYASKGILTDKAVIDNKDKFYLLAELRVDEVNRGVFIDDGQYIPDRSRPLRDVHGYQQYALYPRPDQRYEMDVRCVRRPQKLDAEQDVPRIHAEAVNVLITRAMSYLYESMGNLQASQLMLGRYMELLKTLSKRYGDLRPSAVPILRRMSRARFSYRSRDNYRKWYKTP
jgi:hypothetical protein